MKESFSPCVEKSLKIIGIGGKAVQRKFKHPQFSKGTLMMQLDFVERTKPWGPQGDIFMATRHSEMSV